MLSVANSPDPPCPRKILASGSDEKGHLHPSEKPSSSSEADPADGPDEPQHLRFSIRDYVFSCRSKNGGNNWPFPQQYLQLCVKHGVRDFLPPFEPPDLVRARLSGECEAAEHLIVPLEVEGTRTEVSNAVKRGVGLPTQESVLGSTLEPQNPSSEEKSTVVQAVACEDEFIHRETESRITGHGRARCTLNSVCQFPGSVEETRAVSESSSVVEAVKASSLAEKIGSLSADPSIKKCRLIVKFGGAPESHRPEDKLTSFSSVSDPMASKVCPVCKTFSSSSNTTLNAHIDQCLSAESSANGDAVKSFQHKVKPRKKRCMEDIYATAARCTLEDLDRRNGTNWALELNSISQNSEASHPGESKRSRISPLRTADDESEGAVYVDSNGTKLLILSKFNDARPTATVGCYGAKKCIKKLKNKSSPFGKKRRFPPKYRKYLKAKIQGKTMSPFNRVKGEVRKNDKLHMGTPHEDRRMHQGSNASEQVKVGKPGTLGHWICSKRSSLLKHLNGESSHRNPRNQLAMGHHTSMENDEPSSFRHFPTEEPIQKFYKSPDETSSTSEREGTNVSSDTVLAFGNDERCPAGLHKENARPVGNIPSTSNETVLGCSKSKAKFVSSTKNKRMETCAYAIRMSGKLRCLRKASVDYHPQVHKGKKGSRRSLLTDGPQCATEAIKCKVVQGIVSKKLWKRRFAEKPHKAVGNLPQGIEGFHGSRNAHGLSSTFNNVRSGMPQSSFSQNIVRSETSDTFDSVSSCQQEMINSNQADVHYHASGGEYLTLNNSQLGAECYHAEVTNFDAQVEPPVNIGSVVNYPLGKTLGTYGSEDRKANTCDRLDSSVSLEDQPKPGGANEATNISSLPKLQGDQGMFAGVIASDVAHQDIHQVAQTEFSDAYFSELQNMEYQADVASIQGPNTCLSRPEDKVLELGNILSVNSCRTVAADMHNLRVDREPSGSPVSATSTISHLSEDVKSKDAERESSEEPVISMEKIRPDSMRMGFLMDDSKRWRKTTDLQETARNMQEPEKFCDGQPCYCPRTESIHCKSRILRQSAMAGMMSPININQLTSSLYVRPIISSSGSYSHSTFEVQATPILDSHTHSIYVKAPPDSATSLPTFSSFRSASPSSDVQSQNTSSPILRLMGKNLMVMNKEEKSVQQRSQAVSASSVDTSNGKYMSLLGFSSTCCFSNLDSIQYQSLEGPVLVGHQPSNIQVPIPLPAEQVGRHLGTLLQSVRMLDQKPNSSSIYNLEKAYTLHEQQKPFPVTQAPILERDIIVIDDSPDCEIEPGRSMRYPGNSMAPPFSGSDLKRVRPSSCYPSQDMLQWGDPGSGLKPGFPISCPRRDTHPSKWGSTSESSGSPPPRYFIAPSHSAGQLASTMYHSPHFQ